MDPLDKEKWSDNLNKFKIPEARLLYMIYYLFKTERINYSDKLKLKELAIIENEEINKKYADFEKSKNIGKLQIDLKKLLHKDSDKSQEIKSFLGYAVSSVENHK